MFYLITLKMEMMKMKIILVFGFSHLIQVTSDLGSNPGGSSWHLDFDVRGVHFNASVWAMKSFPHV